MKYKIIIIVIFVVILCLSFYIYKWEFRKSLFNVYFLSLNKGRAVFVRSPDGKTALIGGGQSSEVIRELTKVFPFYRRKIDYLIIPSATPAQIGGLIEVVDRYDVEEVIMSKFMSTSTVLTILQKEINKKKIYVQKVEKGDVLRVGDLEMKILFPYGDFKFTKSSLPEIGLKIEYKNTGLFLLGNLSKIVQKDIAKSLEVKSYENIAEFYNSAIEAKTSPDLLKKIKAKYIFTTKEKTTRFSSDGFLWERN